MQSVDANPISTFLIDEATYQDLVKRANLADLLADRIIALEQQNKAILSRLEELEARLDAHSKKIYRENREAGQTAKDRAARIDKYMATRPDHKASYEALKGFLGIDSALLNLAIAALMKANPGKYMRTKDTARGRGRNKWLVAVPQMA